jgi:hypothetical protein
MENTKNWWLGVTVVVGFISYFLTMGLGTFIPLLLYALSRKNKVVERINPPVAGGGQIAPAAARSADRETKPFRLVGSAGTAYSLRHLGSGTAYSLNTGRNIIGAGPHVQVPVADDSVSREHASVYVESDGRVTLRDNNSLNGTFLVEAGGNLRSVNAIDMRVGDQFQVTPDTRHRFELQK